MRITGTAIVEPDLQAAPQRRAAQRIAWPAPELLRTELLQQLAAGIGKTTLLLAPPGSGKSTVLSQLSCQMLAGGRAVRRLTLSARHNDAHWLLGQLKEILGGEFATADDDLPPIRPGTCVLIDGLEQLQSPSALALMDRFLLSTPEHATLIATGLQLHGAALHDGRMRGKVRVLGAAQLQLSDGDAGKLLGPGFNNADVRRINRFVDGWVAGLRYFCQAGADAVSTAPQMALPSGLSDYFDEVICARVSPDVLSMLCELAVLERFTATLVADLPDTPYNWQLVEKQLLAAFFLNYTDANSQWVAFQPAFGQHLRRRYRLYNPERYQQLQAFSATWFETHGHAAEAVRHAVELPDIPLAASIIERAGAIKVDLDEGPDACLANFISPTQAAELPLLFLAQTYQRIRQGRQLQAEAAFQQAWKLTKGFSLLRGDSDPTEVQAWARMLHVVFLLVRDAPIDQVHIDQLTEEMHRQQVQQPVLAGAIASVLALIYLDASHYAQASAVCAAGMALQTQPQTCRATIWIGHHQASAMLAHGSITDALQRAKEIWQIANLQAQPDSYELLTAQLLLGIVLYEDDQADAAIELIAPALQHVRSINGWVRLYAESYSAAAAIAGSQQGWDAAERVILAGEAFACERNLPRLTHFLATLRVRELVRSRHYEAAKSWLDAPLMCSLLCSDDRSGRQLMVVIPAFLEAASLMLQLGQPREALNYLQRLDIDCIERSDARLQFRYHMLNLRVHFSQGRWAAASSHLCTATAVARRSGLQRQLRENAALVHELRAALSSSSRRLPSDVIDYLDRVLPVTSPSSTQENAAIEETKRLPLPRMEGALSPRENQVMQLIAEGLINKEIATRLGISEGTVKTHRKKIHEKLGVSTRSQAIMRAREQMII